MSGFTNNPPISHVCKPRDRNYHHGTTYATRHTCVTRTVTLNGLRHLLWLLLMWRSNLKKKKARRKRRAVYRQGCSICKVTDGQEEFGVFLGKKDAATLHLKFPPPFGMQVHGPAFLTQASHRNTVFPVWDTNKPASHCWGFPAPHINAKYLLLKTIRTFFVLQVKQRFFF